MLLNCFANVRIVSKVSPRTLENGKTYYNIGVLDSTTGDIGVVGCSAEVYNLSIVDKWYKASFTINTAYLRKDYNCSLTINQLSALDVDNDKSRKG